MILKEEDDLYMSFAERVAQQSYCKRLKVGAIIVKNDSFWLGYNGTAIGEENCCEDENNITKSNVIHAEMNALLKVTRSTQSSEGATLYVTHSPCMNCASTIINSRLKRVVFKEKYRDQEGVKRLLESGIEVIHYDN